MQCIPTKFFSHYTSPSHTSPPLSSDLLLLCFLIRKKESLQVRITNLHIECRQSNSVEKKCSKRRQKAETALLPLLVPQKHQAKSYYICADDMMQALAGLLLATSVSVSLCKVCLIDSVDHSPGKMVGVRMD